MKDIIIDRASSRGLKEHFSWVRDYFVDINDGTLETPQKKRKPYSCDLLISEKCNLRCVKCHFWKSDNHKSVSFEKCKTIIDSLSRIGDRPFEINFGGGEPLLVDRIVELIAYAVKKGLNPALSTNATLITRQMAKKLARSGLSRLSISLDSLDEKTHDTITGVHGSYKKVMQAFQHLAEYWKTGQINIHTVLSACNIDSVIDLVEWVNNHDLISGINIQAVSQPFRSAPLGEWHKTDEYSFLWPSDSAKVNALLDKVIELKKAGYKVINPLHQFDVYKIYYAHPERFARKFRCNFGDHTININALGLMHLCCFMKPLGSLDLSTIEELWLSPQAESTRYQMHNCRESCNNILNCFFEEEDIKAGFTDEIAVRVKDAPEIVVENDTRALKDRGAEPITFCNINITPECHLLCKTCAMGEPGKAANIKNFRKNGLSLGEWRWVIHELSKMNDEKKRMYISGGEPLLRPGLWNLLRFAQDKGFFTILGTSCYSANVQTVHKIIDSGLNFLDVSLYSLNPKVHDYLRGRKGVHKRVMNTATWLHKIKHNFETGASCLITKSNMKDVKALVEGLDTDERFTSIYIQALAQPYDTPACNYWYRLNEYRDLWPDDRAQIDDLFAFLIERKQQGSTKIGNSVEQLRVFHYYYTNPEECHKVKKCMRDHSSLTINWLGYLSFCDYLGPVGNVRDFPLDQLLRSTLATIRRNEMRSCDLQCNFIEQVEIPNLQAKDCV
jgi:MoaA/NifB/PqqE/SkfB family radical SAM enzyme